MKKNIKEMASMNISVSADDTQAVKDLMGILKNAGLENAGPVELPMSMNTTQPPKPTVTPCGSKIEDSYDNEPDEEYQDTEYMIKDLSGGINKEKKMYKAAQRGDNAMAVENEQSYINRLEEMLRRSLNEKKKAKQKDQDGDGDSDFADVQIARMTNSGMSKDEAIKKTKDKPYNKTKKVSESQEVNDILKLALYETNYKKSSKTSAEVKNLKKLAGL